MVSGASERWVRRTAETMRVGTRVRPALSLIVFIATTTTTVSNEYGVGVPGVPIEIKLWDTGRTPLAHMVDVTNSFGLKVLAEHNFLNDNNIAFSPYGLMGILVALFEGVDGEASYQIQMGMQLPWNRNVMRIGFRDIHRTLKTYFIPEEGFLAGLALNNENVTFNDSYKKILRFYGFDLDNDQLPTLAPTNGTNETTTAIGGTEATTFTPTTMPTSSTQGREETTLNPNAETLNDVDVRIPTSTTISPSSAPNAESTTSPPSTLDQDTTQDSTTETTVQTTAKELAAAAITETTTVISETSPLVSILTAETETIAPPTSSSSTAALTEEPSSSATVALTDEPSSTSTAALTEASPSTTGATEGSPSTPMINVEPTVNNEVDTLTTEMSNADTASTVDSTTVTSTTENTQTETETQGTTAFRMETQQPEASMSTADITMTTTISESTLETLERKKKSIVDFIFTHPPYVDDYLIYRSYDIPVPPKAGSPNFDNTMFLANGLRNVQVAYMHYDTVLEHAYLPHLKASALRLPLDSERYYLLVVLPSRGGASQLGRLLSRMARESDLSDIYAALRPRRVRAIVPSFTVKGHVTLTTDLQKLGIRDVFEPRQRDFTPMTHQSGVYVRSIEQAVSVAIRKYRPDDPKKNRYVTNRQPVSFSATYPFLFFVMDSSIHVALMAGKMVDPLNTRIL